MIRAFDSPPVLVCYAIDIDATYRRSLALTNDAVAASVLTLATVLAGQQPETELLDTEEAAKILGVSRAQAQALARDGHLRSIRVGKLYRFRQEFLDEYMRPAPRKGAHW